MTSRKGSVMEFSGLGRAGERVQIPGLWEERSDPE